MQDVDNTQEELELQCYGFFRGSIVGIQYYTGQVNQREVCLNVVLSLGLFYNHRQAYVADSVLVDWQMVNFVREPNNPYDQK